MQNQEKFERYTPQFPLPVDITNMSRQDTVCQFCGVSYLIHNEIKALEAKCAKLEADLVFYAGITSRETALEQQLESERTRVSDLQSTIAMNTHKLNELTRKLQLTQDQYEQANLAHRETKMVLSQCSTYLQKTQQQIQIIRKDYSLLTDFYDRETKTWKSNLSTVQTNLQKETHTIVDRFIKQMRDDRAEIHQSQQQINELNRSIRDQQQNHDQSHLATKTDLDAARAEIRTQHDQLSHAHQQLSHLQRDLEQSKERCQQLERQLLDRDQSKHDVDRLLEQLRHQLAEEKALRLNAQTELEEIRTKFSRLNDEFGQLTISKSQLEHNEATNKRKIDETNRSRQAVLDRTRDEYEKLLRKYTDLDEVYRELLEKRSEETSESQTIRGELERLHNENIELSKQRETLHITHDVHMKKLHDHYSKQLHEAEQWPDRLQSELNREREQHRSQLIDLERRLKESFVTELNIEKQKYNGLLRKYEHDNGHSTEQLRHELISTEKVTIEQRQYYTKQIEQLEKEKIELKNELNQLRDVLKELHDQINHSDAQENNRSTNLQLKEDLLGKETSLFQAQSIITELKKDLEQARNEMNTLQETVHKECTEREQLKDALIDARQQLLTMKKNGVLNGHVARSLHSPPVAFEDIERRVNGPLPYSQVSSQQRQKFSPFVHSEPGTRDSSIPGDAADLLARPMSSTHNAQYRLKTLPPIQSQATQQQRPKGLSPSSNKADQLLANQRRIARFIKHIK